MELTETQPRPSHAIADTIAHAVGWLEAHQHTDGWWLGDLHSNSCMEAEWIFLQHILGLGDSDPKFPHVVQALLNERRPDGSWAIYRGATDGDINTTVEAYVALRIAGHDPTGELLSQTRQWIVDHGGLSQVRNFTRYWLALLGEWPWAQLPTLPPEVIFFPRWFPFSLYRFASWARATIVPLAVLSARRVTRPLPPHQRLDELFPEGRTARPYRLRNRKPGLNWDTFFFLADKALRLYHSLWPWKPARELAIRDSLNWIVRHQEADGCWGGIQPPWVFSLIALQEEGYALSHPTVQAGLHAFDTPWTTQREGATYLQASISPVWDTVLSLLALLEADQDPRAHPWMLRAVDWVLDQQIHSWGDWQVLGPDVPPAGWAFEFANAAYPDTDDTAVALLVLELTRRHLQDAPEHQERLARIERAISSGTTWMVAMQSSNGGWGAFDVDNDSTLITKIPFCDFGEVLDPPSVDVTAHILEALAAQGRTLGDLTVDRAVAWTRSEQEPDGSWFGRWGCNHVYGTGAVLPALAAIGEDMTLPYVTKAAQWVLDHQNPDGGWGETCASYMDPAQRGRGPSTASQTAWALLGLLALGTHDHDDAIRRGLDWLQSHQDPDGTWPEDQYTATGFPGYGVGERIELDGDLEAKLHQDTNLQRAFMIKYDMYRHYFPLLALGRARRHL